MKKFIVLLLIGFGIWWSFKQISRDSGGAGHATAGTVSEGQRVDLKQHLAPDKYTVFLFFANW